nr:ORF31 [Bracoviriform inaniti]
MDKKWKKRMIVNAEKNSERAPSLSAADHFENEQGGLMGQPDVPWVAGLNPGRDKVILCNFSWAIVSERISPKSRLYQHRLSAVSLCPRANAIQWLGCKSAADATLCMYIETLTKMVNKNKMLDDVGQSKLPNKKLGNDSFKKLNKKQRRLLLARLWRSDSESSGSSIDLQTWKNFADSFTLNSTSTEDEDEPEIPSVFRKKNKLVGRLLLLNTNTPSSQDLTSELSSDLRTSASFLQQHLMSDVDLTLGNPKTATAFHEKNNEPSLNSIRLMVLKMFNCPSSHDLTSELSTDLRPSVSFLQQNLTSDADLTLDNQKTATYHKKRSNPSSFFNIQNIPDASNNKINEEGPAPKKHRNSARFKVNIEPREPLPSSSTQKYIQFTVTHEYAPMPYTGTVQRLINVDAPNGISDAIGSSVMDYITSNASLLRSNLDFSIFTCDKYLKQTDSNEGISEKNKSYIPESHKSFTKSNNINSEVFKKLFEDELPSQSVTEFEKLNRLLAESEIHRVELLNRYRIVISGESCLKNCVSKIMAHTLSHEVQSAYSGSGKKFRGVKKLNYSKTETYKCLKDVLEEKFGVEYPELKKLKSRVGQWLSNYVSRSK